MTEETDKKILAKQIRKQGKHQGLTKSVSKSNTKILLKILKLAEPEFLKNKSIIMLDVKLCVICSFDEITQEPLAEYTLTEKGTLKKTSLTTIHLHLPNETGVIH